LLWNVEGLKNLLKNESEELHSNVFENRDIIMFTETFNMKHIDIKGYYAYHSLAAHHVGQRGRPVAGISIYTSPKLGPIKNYVVNAEYLIVRYSFLSLVCVYVSPDKSDLHLVDTISEILHTLKGDSNIILAGDFNARADKRDEKFRVLEDAVGLFGLTMCNDPEVKTFIARTGEEKVGSSTIDLMFHNHPNVKCQSCKVLPTTITKKHLPIESKFKLLIKGDEYKSADIRKNILNNNINCEVA
jgi:hypothetical protein